MAAQRPRSMNVGGENPEFYIRDFTHGVHNFAAREAIGEEEFWWCENAMPLAPGNLATVPGTTAAFVSNVSESGFTPGYAMGFNINGVPYLFAAFVGAGQSGNAYIVNLNTNVVTQIMAGLLSATGSTYATQYGNLGILIIDPNGYWDYNVTTPATLTPWNNTAAFFTPVGGTPIGTTVTGGTVLHHVLTVTGTGGSFQTLYQVTSATITGGGTGYVIGDILSFSDNNPISNAQVTVTAVGGGGVITGIAALIGGSYPGPTSTSGVATGPTGSVVTGGTGTGATFAIKIQATGVKILSPGHGYATGDTVQDATPVPIVINTFTLTSSGVIGGTAIATYAGRVWIANGRTIYFTEVGSYNNFGGSGSFFTITDAYLFNKITCLFSANNYLYIFGPTSIDALSNVTVVAGVVAFSRINVVQGIGTTSPTSVFGYYRGVCFYDPSGFYIMTGASPEKISEKITNIVGQNKLTRNNIVGNSVYGGVVNFRQELCACFMFSFVDNVSQIGTTRAIIAIYFRRRWWFYSTGVNYTVANFAPPMISVISGITNLPTLYQVGLVSGTTWGVYQPLGSIATATWQVKTRLWDAHSPFLIKQAINAAIGAAFLGAPSGITITVDTETGSSASIAMPVQGAPVNYQLLVEQANEGGSQYIGLTINGSGPNVSQVDIIALRGKQEGSLLE